MRMTAVVDTELATRLHYVLRFNQIYYKQHCNVIKINLTLILSISNKPLAFYNTMEKCSWDNYFDMFYSLKELG